MTHSLTLEDKKDKLDAAHSTTFDPVLKAQLVEYAEDRVVEALLMCGALASLNPEYKEIDRLDWPE